MLDLSPLEHQELMTLIEDFEDNLVIKRHEERLKSGEKRESYSLKQVKEICGI